MSTEPSHVDTGAEVAGTEADKINTGALGTLVAVGLLAMLSITAAVTALVRHDIEVEEATKDENANQVVSDLKASQRSKLNGPSSYVDRGKGLVSLPIDLAKGLVVADLERDPNSATPAPPPKAEAGADAGGAASAGAGGAASSAGGAGGTAPVAPASSGAVPAPEKPTEPGKPQETKKAPEPAQEAPKPPTPASAKPMPSPTPTAATPGAQEPGPINH